MADSLVTSTASTAVYNGHVNSYSLGDPTEGVCKFHHLLENPKIMYSALNSHQWNNGSHCGQCAAVTCVDSRCNRPSETEIVYIIDECTNCDDGELAVAANLFSSDSKSKTGMKIEWQFVDCPVKGNITYCFRADSSPFYVSIQPTNVRTGVQQLLLNGKATKLVNWEYYFVWKSGNDNATVNFKDFTIEMVSWNGEHVKEALTVVMDGTTKCVEGQVQFASTAAISSSIAMSFMASSDHSSQSEGGKGEKNGEIGHEADDDTNGNAAYFNPSTNASAKDDQNSAQSSPPSDAAMSKPPKPSATVKIIILSILGFLGMAVFVALVALVRIRPQWMTKWDISMQSSESSVVVFLSEDVYWNRSMHRPRRAASVIVEDGSIRYL